MNWHIICRVGDADRYELELDQDVDRRLVLHFSGGAANTRVRERVISKIEEKYEAVLGGAIHDLLIASMAAYVTDLCIPRQSAEDRWSRSLVLHLPVFELDRWNQAGESLSLALRFLTGDEWVVRPRDRSCTPPQRELAKKTDLPTRACLLSGGLDSLVGAVDLLSEDHATAFVSHHGGGMTPKFQNDTYENLSSGYGALCWDNQFYVVGPQLPGGGENTMRSRSILFLGLGIAVASALGDDTPLVVPENGLISLNVPLTRARSGSSSTRTTHPHFIALMRGVLRNLGINNSIELPYRHKTKGEMLIDATDRAFLESALGATMSCSHPELARWKGMAPGTHCGYCVPCLIRRASVAAAGLEAADTPYTFDVRDVPLPEGRLSDLRAFRMAIAREQKKTAPSCLRVLESGPLPIEEISEYADVFERGMSEVATFLNGAP